MASNKNKQNNSKKNKLTISKKSNTRKKKTTTFSIIVVCILLIIIIIGFTFFDLGTIVKNIIDDYYNQTQNNNSDNSSENENSNNSENSSEATNAPSGNTTEVSNENDLKLTINFVDVGQGDCMIIQFPDGKNMVIDAGDSSTKYTNNFKTLTTSLGITKFDYLLLTHKDSDHSGQMFNILKDFEVGYIFRPNVKSSYTGSINIGANTYKVSDLPDYINQGASENKYLCSTATYFKFLAYTYAEGCPVETFNKDSDFYNIVSYNNNKYMYNVNFLTPTANRKDIKYSDANDYSPIIILEYGQINENKEYVGEINKILLTGDAEAEAEAEFLEFYSETQIDVDVLKVGHHGSKTSSSSSFLTKINPEFAVIQVDANDSNCTKLTTGYKHPRQATLNKLYLDDIVVYRNDLNGTIKLTFDGKTTISASNFIMETESVGLNNYLNAVDYNRSDGDVAMKEEDYVCSALKTAAGLSSPNPTKAQSNYLIIIDDSKHYLQYAELKNILFIV